MHVKCEMTVTPTTDGRAGHERSRSRFAIMGLLVLLVSSASVMVYRSLHRSVDVKPETLSNRAATTMHYDTGVKLVKAGDRVGAMREWSTAIALDPGFAPAYFAMATEDQEIGSYSAAVKRLGALRLANPAAEHVECREVDLYFRAGRLNSALRIGRVAAKREPSCALAHSALGAILAAHSDYEGAVAELQRAHDLDASSEGITLNLAQALAKAGKREEAIKLAGDVLKSQPDHSAQANYVMGRLMAGSGGRADDSTGRIFLEKALKDNQANAGANSELGIVLLRLGKVAEARARLEQAAMNGASDAPTVAALAESYSRLGDPRAKDLKAQARALVNLEANLQRMRHERYRNPESADIAMKLAHLDQQATNTPDAIDLVSFALVKDPNRADALLLMSDLTKSGRTRNTATSKQ